MPPIVLLSFDMETDIGSWTAGYEGLRHGTPRILDVLNNQQVPATFFFIGEAASGHPGIVRIVADAGHEVGCHTLQHETVGDVMFPLPGVKTVLPEECAHRLAVATDAVQQVLGAKVTSFRAPRLWGSTNMVNALEELGYTADATYPLFFYQQRLAPYHPSNIDWTAEGDLRILEIPNFADLTIDSTDPHGRDRDQWPRFRTEGAEALMSHIDNMLPVYQAAGLPTVISLYMHPWEFHQMPARIAHSEAIIYPAEFLTKHTGERAVTELDRLIRLFKERQATFTTACKLAMGDAALTG